MTLLKMARNFFNPSPQRMTLFDKEVGCSRHIPWSYFVTPEIFCTQNNELGAVIKLAGIPFQVQGFATLNHSQQNLSFQLQKLGDQYAVTQTTHRRQAPCLLKADYPTGFSADFASAYNRQFEQAELFVNDLYLGVIQKTGSTVLKKGFAWLETLSARQDTVQYEKWKNARLKAFETALAQLLTSLQAYSPILLGKEERAEQAPSAQPLAYLSALVNARAQAYPYPYQDIATFVPQARLFFGRNTIHFQYPTAHEDKYGAILSIKHYAPFTQPGMLDALLTVPFECLVTHSFTGIDTAKAIAMVDLQMRQLQNTNDAAVSQIRELKQAKDDLASGKINYGFHHNTVLVLSETLDALEEAVPLVIKQYADKRIHVVRETLNLESAFWAQIPGNFRANRRQAPISSHNFSSFCSLHNYHTGYVDQNHLGGAVMLVETQSKTPFYLNLHRRASGRQDDLPVGHTLLIAPSGAGKTVLMTGIDAMMGQYQPLSIFFDRNCGVENYVRASGGLYHRLIPGQATGWNPCQLDDTPANRKFLQTFLEALSTSAATVLTANDIGQIAEVVDRNFSLPFEKRNLSNISSFFEANFNGLDALSRYLRLANAKGLRGDRAYLFDNETDTFNLSVHKIGFDMTHWFSEAGEASEELYPMTLYILHRLKLCLDGRLVGLYMDEGWQVFMQPYWRAELEEFLATGRKRNLFVFLATQLASKLAQSTLAPALINNTATQIYLANPMAEEHDYCGTFKLSKREFQIIKALNPAERYFLFKQGHEAAVARFNLKGLEQYMGILSTNESHQRLVETLRAQHGDEPQRWLPLFYQQGGYHHD